MTDVIDAFLNEYEEINKVSPIKGLRWSFSHLDQVTEAQLERMKKLGMTAQIHSRPLIQGALMHKEHGDKAWDMPPFRRVQDSGIRWGLGSDATAVTTSNPFYTLGFAVTGKMVGGKKVNRQSITREEALIAHTRSNAFIVFQEANLGSIQNGKYADLLVLDDLFLARHIAPQGADELQSLLHKRYKLRRSTLITSNRIIDDWAHYLGDSALATTILDRLMHRSVLVEFKGRSYRLKHAASRLAKTNDSE